MIRRLIKDFKSNTVFSACFDDDIVLTIFKNTYIFLVHECVESSLPVLPTFTTLHPKLWVNFILRLSKVSD